MHETDDVRPDDIRVRDVPRRSFLGTALYLVGAASLLGACGETVTSDTPDLDSGDVFSTDSDPSDLTSSDSDSGDPFDSD